MQIKRSRYGKLKIWTLYIGGGIQYHCHRLRDALRTAFKESKRK